MTRFASLTAGLLARKGEAEPASTVFADQLLTRVGATGPDMRVLAATTIAAPITNPAVYDTERAAVPCHPCPPSSEQGDPDKTFHVNLRLKRPRFVKLKLSAALLRRPTQDIVSEALDQWFERLPADVLGICGCMRGTAN